MKNDMMKKASVKATTMRKTTTKKTYKRPEIFSEGNYSAWMSSCGKLVSGSNSACGH